MLNTSKTTNPVKMAIVSKKLFLDLLLLVAALTLKTALGIPQISPSPAVPESLSASETLSINTLKLLSSCHVRIVVVAPASNILDPYTADMVHFITTTFSDLKTTYSVLQIGSTTLESNLSKAFENDNILEYSGLPSHIRRYGTKARNPQRSSSNPHALVLVTSKTSSFEFTPEWDSQESIFALGSFLETLLATMGVPKYFLIVKTRGRTNPKWLAKRQNHRSQHMFVLTNWTSLMIGQSVITKASDVQTRAQEPSNLKNFDGDFVNFFKTELPQLESGRVFVEAILPEICAVLNATLIYNSYSFENSNTILMYMGGAETLDTFSTPQYVTVFSWLKGTETFPQVTFVMVTDPLVQQVSVYIQPMDMGTWLGTILSVAAVVVFTKFAVQDMRTANLMFDIPMTFIGQGASSSTIHKVRLVFTAWLLALIVINGGYTGLVFSHMTSPRSPPVPETVKDLNNYDAGDLISNARIRMLPHRANQIADEVISNNVKSLEHLNPWTKKAIRDKLYNRLVEGLPFFLIKVEKKKSLEKEAFLKRIGNEGWTEFESKVKFLESKTADILMALVNPKVSLKHVPRSMTFDPLNNFYPYKLPPNHVYLGPQAEVRVYKLLLETLGLHKLVSKEITLSLFSTVQLVWGTRTQGTILIQRKLMQLFEGGFVSMWHANASRFHVIDYFKGLQDNIRHHLERQLELLQLKMTLKGEGMEEHMLKDATPKMPPKLSNFLANRNSMVHLFNDFVSATSVNLKTVSGELSSVNFPVLFPALIVCGWATVLAGCLLLFELLVSTVSLV